MAERPNALVLKTSVGKLTEGSNPSVSAIVESRDIVPIYGVSRLCRSRASFTQLQIVAILLVGGDALKSRREGDIHSLPCQVQSEIKRLMADGATKTNSERIDGGYSLAKSDAVG